MKMGKSSNEDHEEGGVSKQELTKLGDSQDTSGVGLSPDYLFLKIILRLLRISREKSFLAV
jgi:hypothetical protein